MVNAPPLLTAHPSPAQRPAREAAARHPPLPRRHGQEGRCVLSLAEKGGGQEPAVLAVLLIPSSSLLGYVCVYSAHVAEDGTPIPVFPASNKTNESVLSA